MKNITQIKNKIVKLLLKRNGITNVDACPEGLLAKVQTAAEVLAYQRSVIPFPYYQYDINSFNGKNDGVNLIKPSVAIEAKKKIVEYCWKDLSLDDLQKMDPKDIEKKSCVSYRREEGHNVAIFSGSTNGPSGKTLCASLIMKEAIKRRINPKYLCESYDWISYSGLCQLLRHDSDEDSKIDSILRTCDWLVVDDIDQEKLSEKRQLYYASLIEPFFSDRLKDRLPTILVFRFDPSMTEILSDKFGVSIQQILTNKKTLKINLS